MIYRDNRSPSKTIHSHLNEIHPIKTAKRFIQLFHQVETPNEEQCLMLAAAHYTLANQLDISLPNCRLHANAAITVLQNIQEKKPAWQSQIAQAYFKRAELLEEEHAYLAASHDYQRAIEVIERENLNDSDTINLLENDKLMLAKCAISIADLIINNQITYKEVKHAHPLFYINKSLEYLNDMVEYNEEVITVQSYAHQLAGIALNSCDFEAAVDALQKALKLAFKTCTKRTFLLLMDIYNCLGLLYEAKSQHNIIKAPDYEDIDEAMIYFGIALLFTKCHSSFENEGLLSLESLFEIIYRLLDPYFPSLSNHILYNVIDGLIIAYMGLLDDNLPNHRIKQQLSQPETLDIFAQHIYWLVLEAYHKHCPHYKTLKIFDPNAINLTLDKKHIFALLQDNIPNNVYYLKLPERIVGIPTV